MQGITPAWAGKSCPARCRSQSCGDHPRVGGEKMRASPRRTYLLGSPPRGRGKSRWRFSGRLWSWDHPRVGGEKRLLLGAGCKRLGSPPRGRGKEYAPMCQRTAMRITPAWAGKRLKRSHRSGIFISGPIPFHSVLHRPAGSGGSRAGRDGSPAGQPQNAGPA